MHPRGHYDALLRVKKWIAQLVEHSHPDLLQRDMRLLPTASLANLLSRLSVNGGVCHWLAVCMTCWLQHQIMAGIRRGKLFRCCCIKLPSAPASWCWPGMMGVVVQWRKEDHKFRSPGMTNRPQVEVSDQSSTFQCLPFKCTEQGFNNCSCPGWNVPKSIAVP